MVVFLVLYVDDILLIGNDVVVFTTDETLSDHVFTMFLSEF